MNKFVNSAKGDVVYGMHFYPGVAQYDEPGKDSLMVFLNENTIREMGATFAGCPVYVNHVDGVDEDLDKVKGEVDGWVLESFFNEADGKHWVKFIICSERGRRAIKRGWRLSNAYVAQNYGPDGIWNGVTYDKEITRGEFEHLAIVPDPRYEESVIMTPDAFKAYNSECKEKLLRLANSKTKGVKSMKLKFWERPKIKNEKDFDADSIMVELPKSKKEVTLAEAIDIADKFENMAGYAANEHMVKVGENEMSVGKLVKAHVSACNELDELKKKNAESEDGGEPGKGADDDEDVENSDNDEEDIEREADKDLGDRGGDKGVKNEEDHEEDASEKDDKKKNDLEAKRKAKEKAARLKNAHRNAREEDEEVARIELANDRVARGKQRYGSGK